MEEKQQGEICHPVIRWIAISLIICWTNFASTARLLGNDNPGVSEVSRILTDGSQLENQGMWSDALLLYQEALRHNPDDTVLLQRRSLARLHYDLEKRQSDRSFIDQVASTNGVAARNIYAEILLKIQSYYVDEPNWNEIARFGLTSVKFALSEPEFRKRHLPGVSSERIDSAFEELSRDLNQYIVRERTDAVWVADRSAESLARSLSLPPQAVTFEFICGAASALDPYSAFMSGNQYGETMSQIEGNFVGLGVELKTEQNRLEVISVIEGGPASNGGIKGGDRILSVDNREIAEIGSEAGADLLRGVEGSTVTLVIERDETRYKTALQRRRVEIPSVDNVRIIDKGAGIGYLRITSFQKTTTRDFDIAMQQLRQSGMKSLVMDLRGNPGGLLTSAVEIADRFVDQGILVSTRGRNPLEEYTHRAHSAGTVSIPLIVLIDGHSASASEILAAAIRDHGRGRIVGEKSYGKGSVQGIFPLNVSGGGIRLTTARFYSPGGKIINQVGVTPDVTVVQTAKPALSGSIPEVEDSVLQTAVSIFRPSALSPSIQNAVSSTAATREISGR